MATRETNQGNRYNYFPVKWGWKREFLKFIFSRTGETGHPEVSLTWWEAFYGWLDHSFRKFWHDRRRKQQWFKTHPSSKLIRRETESESWLRHHFAISGAWCGSMHFLPLVIGSFGCWSPVTWQLVHFFTRITFNHYDHQLSMHNHPHFCYYYDIGHTHTFHLHHLVIVSQIHY